MGCICTYVSSRSHYGHDLGKFMHKACCNYDFFRNLFLEVIVLGFTLASIFTVVCGALVLAKVIPVKPDDILIPGWYMGHIGQGITFIASGALMTGVFGSGAVPLLVQGYERASDIVDQDFLFEPYRA